MRAMGFGMFEFLIALLIFSTALLALLSTQISTITAVSEAQQRSIATGLARDILARIQSNSGEYLAYGVRNMGDTTNPRSLPATDCTVYECSANQMAEFDLWQWEGLLMGAAEQTLSRNTGGLLRPRACITSGAKTVSVAISWLGFASAEHSPLSNCGAELLGLYDDESAAPGNNLRRRQLMVSMYLGSAM